MFKDTALIAINWLIDCLALYLSSILIRFCLLVVNINQLINQLMNEWDREQAINDFAFVRLDWFKS